MIFYANEIFGKKFLTAELHEGGRWRGGGWIL